MGTDDLFKKRRAERQKRKHEFKSVNTNSFLIVTEGEKTEPLYFKGLFEHFYTCGMAEGRRASENFDVSVYKANNPDLVAVFGDDLKAYYTHYVQSGQLENRVCK